MDRTWPRQDYSSIFTRIKLLKGLIKRFSYLICWNQPLLCSRCIPAAWHPVGAKVDGQWRQPITDQNLPIDSRGSQSLSKTSWMYSANQLWEMCVKKPAVCVWRSDGGKIFPCVWLCVSYTKKSSFRTYWDMSRKSGRSILTLFYMPLRCGNYRDIGGVLIIHWCPSSDCVLSDKMSS